MGAGQIGGLDGIRLSQDAFPGCSSGTGGGFNPSVPRAPHSSFRVARQ